MTAAVGPLMTTQELWRQMLAKCSAFQAWPGGDGWDESEALEHLHHDRLPDPADGAEHYSDAELAAYLPYGIVWTDPAGGYEMEAVAVSDLHTWEPSGRLAVDLYRVPDEGEAEEESDLIFRNRVGQIIQSGDRTNPGLVELVGLESYLVLKRIQVFGPTWTRPEENPSMGVVQTMRIVVEW